MAKKKKSSASAAAAAADARNAAGGGSGGGGGGGGSGSGSGSQQSNSFSGSMSSSGGSQGQGSLGDSDRVRRDVNSAWTQDDVVASHMALRSIDIGSRYSRVSKLGEQQTIEEQVSQVHSLLVQFWNQYGEEFERAWCDEMTMATRIRVLKTVSPYIPYRRHQRIVDGSSIGANADLLAEFNLHELAEVDRGRALVEHMRTRATEDPDDVYALDYNFVLPLVTSNVLPRQCDPLDFWFDGRYYSVAQNASPIDIETIQRFQREFKIENTNVRKYALARQLQVTYTLLLVANEYRTEVPHLDTAYLS